MLKSNAVCSGQQLSISCGDQRLVHILYETYSYTATPCTNDLDPELVECTKAEFLVPVSVDHCNGRASCTFAVPTNTTISSCGQTATALWVHYACIPSTYCHTAEFCVWKCSRSVRLFELLLTIYFRGDKFSQFYHQRHPHNGKYVNDDKGLNLCSFAKIHNVICLRQFVCLQ